MSTRQWVSGMWLAKHISADISFLDIRGEREFPFPTIPGNTSLPFPFPKVGNGFFIPIPVPKSWEWNSSFPFPFPIVGNVILHSRSIPGNGSGMNNQFGIKIYIIHLWNQNWTYLKLQKWCFSCQHLIDPSVGIYRVLQGICPKWPNISCIFRPIKVIRWIFCMLAIWAVNFFMKNITKIETLFLKRIFVRPKISFLNISLWTKWWVEFGPSLFWDKIQI